MELEKLDEKTGKMKEENNKQSERWNFCCVDLNAAQSGFNVVKVSVVWQGQTLFLVYEVDIVVL